jgi:hypothetical protein
MSSSSGSTNDQSNNRSRGQCCGGWGKKGNWSGLNIAAMVLGFVFFWPVGLFVLYWIITGRNVKKMPQEVRHQWSRVTGNRNGNDSFSNNGRNDNVVFNEFQQTQYDRIREIKEEVKARSHRFSEFRTNAKRRADEDEFNRFMADAPGRTEG